MNAAATITLSNAIIEAQSVHDIAKRLANAPTENGADGCEAGELSRNQLLGQHAYHYCMDSDSPIAADDFAKFPCDFSAYLTAKLSDFVRIAVEDLENEANDAAQHDEYPLSRADIAQLSESVALEHAVKLAIQQAEPADTRGIYSYNDTHFLVPSAGEGYELEAREICYWLRQDDGTCIHQGADPFDSLAKAKAGLADVQKNLGWTDLKIVRAEKINGSIHESTVAWGLDAGDLCVMADVSETGVIKISGAAEAESWSDVREAADKIEFVQRLQCGWVNYAGHYQVWAHGNPEPLNYLVAEAAETEADE